MTRRLVPLLSAVVALTLLAGSLPGGAGANSAPGDGSSRSQAAAVTQGAGLTLTPRVSVVGVPVIDTLSAPLTAQVVNPIVNALVAVPNAVTAGLTNALVSAGLAAQNGTGRQPRPGSGYPTCGQRGWDASNCFGPLTPTASAPPALTLTTGTAQGYATADDQGYIAAARVANPNLTVLGFPLGDLGVVTSSASCNTTAASCSASQSFSGGSLLADKLQLSLADGGALVAKIGGVPVPAAGQTINVGGFATTVRADSSLATITVALTLTQLLAALGLPNLLSTVSALGVLGDDGTTAALTIKVGPGNISKSSPASAWGLAVSVDLTVAVKLKLLNVLGASLATVTVSSTSTPPSVVDLKLAYSAATAGNLQPGWVPPALV